MPFKGAGYREDCITIKRTLLYLIPALFFCSCGKDKEDKNPPDMPESQSISATENEDYSKILVRPWTFSDVFGSLSIGGIEIIFPFSAVDLSEKISGTVISADQMNGTFACGDIFIPGSGSIYAEWTGTDENPLNEDSLSAASVSAACFKSDKLTKEFSLYGLEFGMSPEDISGIMGIADEVSGDYKTGSFSLEFFGNEKKTIKLTFEDNGLSEVFVAC